MELLSYGDNGWGDDLLWAAVLTIQLALCAVTLGFSLGIGLAGMKVSRFAPLRWFAETYTLIIRGVPEFLVLLLVFFGSEAALNSGLALIGSNVTIEIPKFLAAVLGLGVIFGAYSCEVFRGAYLAVPNGQIEAGKAVGLSSFQILWNIRFPQLWRFAIPGLGNLWMVMIKDTSLAAVIALDELLRVAKVAGEATRNPLLFLLAAGLLYLIMTSLSDIVRAKAERTAKRGYTS
ncbi:MAG: ABC transporter permease subunit [Hyphomicrobiales bacterium]